MMTKAIVKAAASAALLWALAPLAHAVVITDTSYTAGCVNPPPTPYPAGPVTPGGDNVLIAEAYLPSFSPTVTTANLTQFFNDFSNALSTNTGNVYFTRPLAVPIVDIYGSVAQGSYFFANEGFGTSGNIDYYCPPDPVTNMQNYNCGATRVANDLIVALLVAGNGGPQLPLSLAPQNRAKAFIIVIAGPNGFMVNGQTYGPIISSPGPEHIYQRLNDANNNDPEAASSNINQAGLGFLYTVVSSFCVSWTMVSEDYFTQNYSTVLAESLKNAYPVAAVAPAAFTASLQAPDEIDFSWTDSSVNEESFVVEGSASGSFATVDTHSFPANTTAGSLTGVAPGTYYFRIKATNGTFGDSPYTVASTNPIVVLAPPTPTATPEDSGFVPPDANTGKCEDLVAKHLRTLSGCIAKCQIKQADAALKGKSFDEEACEQGTGKPVSCRTAYNNATTKLLGRTPAICPPCLDATAQSNLGDLVENSIETGSGLAYCAGTATVGGDDPGLVPPDANTGKCEDLVVTHLRTLFGCMTKCQIKQADTALYNATHSKQKVFDEEACEQGTGKPVSCRTAYNNATTKLLGRTPAICPPCLDATAQSNLADLAVNFVENVNGLIYCAGATPLP